MVMDEDKDLKKKALEEFKEDGKPDLENANKPFENSYQFATEKKKSKKSTIVLIIVIILLLAGGFFILSNRLSKQAEPESTPTPVPTPTQTPKPALNKADWSLEVLNGSGITGAAKVVADKLKELGYPVVKTGNADKSNYEQTQILVKEELKDKVDLLIADLKDIVKIASVAGELKDSTASARIIIGKD